MPATLVIGAVQLSELQGSHVRERRGGEWQTIAL